MRMDMESKQEKNAQVQPGKPRRPDEMFTAERQKGHSGQMRPYGKCRETRKKLVRYEKKLERYEQKKLREHGEKSADACRKNDAQLDAVTGNAGANLTCRYDHGKGAERPANEWDLQLKVRMQMRSRGSGSRAALVGLEDA